MVLTRFDGVKPSAAGYPQEMKPQQVKEAQAEEPELRVEEPEEGVTGTEMTQAVQQAQTPALATKWTPAAQVMIGAKQSFDLRELKRMGEIRCQSCASRMYQDESSDPGVSYQAPTHIAPEQSASAVRAHEQEHMSREKAKAAQTGQAVVSQSMQVFTSCCPECGKVFVSGGVAKTVTRDRPETIQMEQQAQPSAPEPRPQPEVKETAAQQE